MYTITYCIYINVCLEHGCFNPLHHGQILMLVSTPPPMWIFLQTYKYIHRQKDTCAIHRYRATDSHVLGIPMSYHILITLASCKIRPFLEGTMRTHSNHRRLPLQDSCSDNISQQTALYLKISWHSYLSMPFPCY